MGWVTWQWGLRYPVQGDVGNLETQDDDPDESQDERLVSVYDVLWSNERDWHLWAQVAGFSMKPMHWRRCRVTTSNLVGGAVSWVASVGMLSCICLVSKGPAHALPSCPGTPELGVGASGWWGIGLLILAHEG